MYKKILGLGSVALAAILLTGAVQVFASPTTTWTVDGVAGDHCNGGHPNCTTIQAAVDKSGNGDTININAGTYDAFSVVGKTNLTIDGAGEGSTVVHPTTLINTGVADKYDVDMHSSVFVNSSTGITVKNMTIQSTNATPVSSSGAGTGVNNAIVFWNHSSGTIANSNITGTYTINGVQTGQGIAVDASTGTNTLAISNVNVSGFQKNGIQAIDGNGATSGATDSIVLTVTGGSITGAGATTALAQNGIVVWNRGGGTVTGTVNGTSISNLNYTPSPEDVGVYAVGSTTFSTVSNVTFVDTDLYLWNGATSAIDATTGNTFDGVSATSATGSQLATIEGKIGDIMSNASIGGSGAVFVLPDTYIVTLGNKGIQTGLNTAASNDTVLVTPGTYTGDIFAPATSNLTLEGKDGPVINLGSGYGINLDNNVIVPNFTFEGFTVNASPSTTYAFKAYKANGLTLNSDTFNGGVNNAGGGVDINTTSNVTFNNVTSSGFHKNGFADTSAYTTADDSVSGNNMTFNNITASNDGWTGISFYTTGNSGGSASVSGVTFTGVNTLSNDGAGIFLEGDTDAHFGTFANPANKITSDGTTLDLTHAGFSGNSTYDITNYQAAPVNAIGATFDPGAITGDQMSSAQRTAEDGRILDQLDHSNLGLVTYYAPTVTVSVEKFIDGNAASTTAVTDSFPMQSSWNAINIGSGSGTYSLSTSGFNSPNAYEAVTSPMSAGADYATNEVTGGSVVGADCSGGQPFKLAGYTSGTSLASAEAATPSLTSPSLTDIQNNAWVIVWNTYCLPTPTITTPTNGMIVTSANMTEVDWTSVTDTPGDITYTYQASNSSDTNPDGSFSSTVYTQSGLTNPTIPTPSTPEGTYYIQVQAKDADGNVSGWSPTVEVIVDNSPSVTTVAANPFADTSATVNATVGGINADNTSFWWGTTNAGPFTAGAAPTPPAGWQHDSGLGSASANANFNEPLTNLIPGTTYYFAAWVQSGGTWYPGSVLSFSTTGVTPTASVTTEPANPIDVTDATLNGQNGGLAADNTSFWWGPSSQGPFTSAADPTSELPIDWTHDTGLGGSVANGSFDESVSGLTAGTQYYFAAWSHIGGVWYPGTVLNFTTGTIAPVPGVTTNVATSISDSDATLNGMNGGVDADQESFWVSTSTIDTSSSTIPPNVYSTPVLSGVAAGASFTDQLSIVTTNGIISVGGVNENQNMPAITPDTTYNYVAWANVGGTWYPGAVQTFETSDAPPTAPTADSDTATTNMNTPITIDVLANDTGATGIDAGTLTQPTDGTAVINGNEIDYSPNSNFAGTDTFTYEATNSIGSSSPATVTVTVEDTTTPVLTLNGNNPAYVQVGTNTYSDLGVTITDTPTDNLSYTIATNGAGTTTPASFSLDTTVEGTYTLTYSATDGGGNTGTTTRTVIVDGTPPTVALTSDSTSPTSDSPIHVTATFSEPVAGFDEGDIAGTNAGISNFEASSTDDLVYTFDMTPTVGATSVSATIGAGDFADLAGNTNADPASISFDITSSNSNPGNGGGGGGGGGISCSLGDINCDGKVNIVDLAILVGSLGSKGANLAADLNHDGVVNLLDLAILLANWSK